MTGAILRDKAFPLPDIRPVAYCDAPDVAAIYNHYVTNSVATFEETSIEPAEMVRRIDAVQARSLPWLVALDRGGIAGYAHAGSWKPRSAYRYTVEITVYLAPARVGQRIGSSLYSGLFAQLKTAAIHAVIAGIALPNEASVALHEKFGMSRVAHFREQGFKFGRWVDVAYWQILL